MKNNSMKNAKQNDITIRIIYNSYVKIRFCNEINTYYSEEIHKIRQQKTPTKTFPTYSVIHTSSYFTYSYLFNKVVKYR